MKKKVFLFAYITLTISLCLTIAAHPGYTDENGGHWDHETNTYHYHISETTEPQYSYDSPKLNAHEHYSVGYDNGYKEGLKQSQKNSYNEGYTAATEKYKTPSSVLGKIAKYVIDFINKYFFTLLLAIILLVILLCHIRWSKNLRTSLSCDGIAYYTARARKVNEPGTLYTYKAEVFCYTTEVTTYAFKKAPHITASNRQYFLHRLYWPTGGHIQFDRYCSQASKYKIPELKFGKQIKATSTKGDDYYITLTQDLFIEPSGDLAIFNQNKKKFEDDMSRQIKKFYDNATSQHNYFSSLIADYHHYLQERLLEILYTKKHPSPKASEELRLIKSNYHTLEKKEKQLRYKFEMLQIAFPWLSNLDKMTLGDAKRFNKLSHKMKLEEIFAPQKKIDKGKE